MKALVNKIIPFSSVDGPGNRTAVFLQGCNIDCKYCHNPETRATCVHCGLCVKKCPAKALSFEKDASIPTGERVAFDPMKCVSCDTCIHVCPHDSTPKAKWMEVSEVMACVRKQIPFIRGISVSGGECMLEPAFLTELFTEAKAEGLTTLIDTNGTVDFRDQRELLSVTDGVMLDIKAFRDKEHRDVTGETNRIVLSNAEYLGEIGKLYEVRCVIVPDLYDTERSVTEMADFLKPFYEKHPFRIKLIAFRSNGVRTEYRSLRSPGKDDLMRLSGILKKKGYQDIILI